MSDYPEELDSEDLSELASYIERRYPTELLRMHDTRTIHFAYWDKSHRSVSPEFLDHIQQAGYRILYAGKATCPRRGTQRAWVECQKYNPETNETISTENAGDDAISAEDENTALDESEIYSKSDVYRVSCDHCDEEYLPDEAATITIQGPGEVWYTCPLCGYGTRGLSPLINKD